MRTHIVLTQLVADTKAHVKQIRVLVRIDTIKYVVESDIEGVGSCVQFEDASSRVEIAETIDQVNEYING